MASTNPILIKSKLPHLGARVTAIKEYYYTGQISRYVTEEYRVVGRNTDEGYVVLVDDITGETSRAKMHTDHTKSISRLWLVNE